MKKLLLLLILLGASFGAGFFVAYTNMDAIIAENFDGVIDQTIDVVSSELQTSLESSLSQSGSLAQPVDDWIATQKQNVSDTINAEKEKLKESVKASITEYVNEKINTIFN